MNKAAIAATAAVVISLGTQAIAQSDLLNILPQLQNRQDWQRQNPNQQQQQPNQQQPAVAGQWFCEMGFHNTAPGVKPEAVGMQFNIAVYPNGQAQGQGQDMGSAGYFPFQFQAQWAVQNGMFIVQGQKYGGMSFSPQETFFFQSKLMGQSDMAFTHRYQNQKMQVYASQCRRQG